MELPSILRAALECEARHFTQSELGRAQARLSECYRAGKPPERLSTVEVAAYAVARMPATYAACSAVLAEVRRRLEAVEKPLTSLLDLGAGLGSMLWAAAENSPSLKQATLLDANRDMIQFGQRLAEKAETEIVRGAKWRHSDLSGMKFEQHDLVSCSYALGEMADARAAATVANAWNAAGKVLVIIEPGTPAGFAHIRKWRTKLLGIGAHMLAPCPHAAACPIPGNDWCHFAQRVERTSLHRRLKGGALGWEDEKYSYIAVSKFPVALPAARIIRHPQVAPGAIKLELCASGGLNEVIATRKNKEEFRRARRAAWGDVWESLPANANEKADFSNNST